MAAKDDLTIPLLPDRLYHIYNRGINKEPIFYNPENFRYFLIKYGQKMTGYFNTFGYCLLDNHFHLFVRVAYTKQILAKAADDFDVVNQIFYKDYVMPWVRRMKLEDFCLGVDLTNFKNLLNLFLQHGDLQKAETQHPLDLNGSSFIEQLCSWVVSDRFRGFMLGYAKAINKQENRTGSLFQKGFRRKYVSDEIDDKKNLLFYLHHNPIHHFYTNSYEDYFWSSYNSYSGNSPTRLCKNETISWFGSIDNFIEFGKNYKLEKKINATWLIKED